MNRFKVWLFVLLVGAAAVAAVRFTVVAQRGVISRALDARLEAASARLAGSVRMLSSETAAVAALAARDAKLVELLHAKEAAPAPRLRRVAAAAPADPAAEDAAVQSAARAAMASAEAAVGFTLPEGTQLYAANREAYARKAQDPSANDRELVESLGAAIKGEPRRGLLRWSDALWFSAAVPAGEGAGLVLLVPVDGTWIRTAVSGSGADLTITAEGLRPLTTLTGKADALVAAARSPSAPRDAGRLAAVPVNVLGVRVAKPALLFLDGAPAHRVLAVGLPGLAGVTAVVSAPAAALLAPIVEAQWTVLVGIAALVLVGLLMSVLVRPADAPPPVPPELLAAADKIGRGDFTVRAPALAGKLGTVATALNRAAEAAAVAASAPAGGAPSLTQEFFAGGEKVAPAPAPAEADPSTFEFPMRPPPAAARAADPLPAAPIETPVPAAPALGGGAFEAAPVPAPAARAASVITPPPPAAAIASAPELLQAAARTVAPSEAGNEDQHWRDVFQDFLRVRGECGESAEGLTFERFRAKLETNKAALVAKYACRTVRFQVYVKEGKAALKATPVR